MDANNANALSNDTLKPLAAPDANATGNATATATRATAVSPMATNNMDWPRFFVSFR